MVGRWDEAERHLEEVLQLAPGHEMALNKLHDIRAQKAKDAQVRALMAEAQDLAGSHQYDLAIECYDQALVTGTLANVLSYHAQCEREQDACRKRLEWQGNVQDACRRAESLMQREEWQDALVTLDDVLADLQATDHADLAQELEDLRLEITTTMGNEALLRQADEAWESRSYERAIKLAQQVLDSDPRLVQRHKAVGIIRDNRETLQLVWPTGEEAQNAYDKGRLDDAAVLLTALAPDPENGLLVASSGDTGRITLLDGATGKIVAENNEVASLITSLAIAGGRYIAAGTPGGRLALLHYSAEGFQR